MPFCKKTYLLFIFISTNIFSQNIDDKLVDFTNKLQTLNSFNEKVNYLDSIMKNNNDLEIQYFINYNLGRLYYKNKIDLIRAKKYLLNAKKKASNSNDTIKRYNVNLNLGHINLELNSGDSALYYYNKALRVSQNKKDFLLVSRTYSNIARLYGKENKKELAIKFFYKSISIGKKVNRNLCTTYNNLGNVYLEFDNDSAIYYYKKSLIVAKKFKKVKRELRANVNLAIAYLNDTLKLNKSKLHLFRATKIATKLKEEKYLYYINYNLGKYYNITDNHKKALIYYNLALNSPYSKIEYEQQIELLRQLSLFHEKQGNYKKANNFQKQYHHLKDSIYSVEKNKAFNDIKTKYDVVEKDNQISLLSKEKELAKNKRKTIIITSSLLISILVLLTYFLRNKINTQKLVRVKEQKLFEQELKTKKALSLIEGQENEQHRLAKELHDGLGGQLAGVKSMIQTITTKNIQEKTKLVDLHLETSIKNLRNISHDLSANFLKNQDFDVLIQQLVHQSFATKNIRAEVSIFPTQKINALSERYQLNIYRILQESFQNILKHAKANSISVSLSLDQEINILIEDNGIGFKTTNKSKGIGLQNIKDRLQSLNGSLHIDSKITKGTTLNINIPNNDYRNSNS